jgi:hypothetical protein
LIMNEQGQFLYISYNRTFAQQFTKPSL